MKRHFAPYLTLAAAVLLLTSPAYGAQPQKHNEAGVRTEALDNSAWSHSQWISAADAPIVRGSITGNNQRSADGAAWFVTEFKNNKKLTGARWMTSGLGVYNLYVNGKSIGAEILKPGFTHYAKTKLSFTYDITDALNTDAGASNTLSVQVTPGWWGDKIITPEHHNGMIGKKTAFRGVLELTFSDGSKEYIGSNTNDWRACIGGPVTHAGIFDGEEYDARINPVHGITADMSKPEVNSEFPGDIYPSDGAEVYLREDLAIKPVEAYTWKGVTSNDDSHHGTVVKVKEFKPGKIINLEPGETLVVDFGQNCAAVPQFEFSAAEGTVLTCLPAELLNDGNGAHSRGMDGPEGSGHRLNLRDADNSFVMRYTFGNNDNWSAYRPECSFFGYRYISLTADSPVRIKSIYSIPVSSIAERLETGTLVTGNDLINKLISNTIWGQRSNYLSVPTDCPQRNERLGWTADTQVFSETGTFFANTRDFFHKWMRDMRDSQGREGGFPGVAPLAQYGNEMCRLGWSDAAVIVPWVVWKQFADTDIVNQNWEAMERYMHHINSTKYRHEDLLSENGNFQWADWLSYEPLESCAGRQLEQDENGNWRTRSDAYVYWNYLSACYWLMDAEMMADMARATSRDSSVFEEMAVNAREYIQENFLNADGSFKSDILNTMQTPALFALRGRLVEGEAKKNTIERLRENFARHDNCLQTGFLGTAILMPTLSDNGMTDIAYELLFQRKNPSWLYSVDNGATTIWERWNSYTKENGMGPSGMNSFNHYAYGCVCEWLWKTAAGISSDTSAPGFKRIIMKPMPDRRLGFVNAEYDSAAGKIKSSWKFDNNRWNWSFTVPQGCVAEVTLPGETLSKEYTAGSYKLSKIID